MRKWNDEQMKSMTNEQRYTYDWRPESADDDTKPILKITKSSLLKFKRCAQDYYYCYPMRLPQDQNEAMIKGTTIHNAYEDFFDEVDIKKMETMNRAELIDYCSSHYPVDDYEDQYRTLSVFEADRFIAAKESNTIENYLPAGNEVQIDTEIIVPAGINPKYPTTRQYWVHLQGIIDRLFIEDGAYIPVELKTGAWKDSKKTDMRLEMAFYKFLLDEATDEELMYNPVSERGNKQELNLERLPVTHWAWHYTGSNNFLHEEVKSRSTTAVWHWIGRLLWAYENNEFDGAYHQMKCKFCSFTGRCPAAMGSGEYVGEWF